MNYLKTFFITIILLNIGTTFNSQENQPDHIVYSAQTPSDLDILPEPTILESTTETPETEEVIQQESSGMQEWNNHLSTLGENWNAADNIPANSWKIKAFALAENALEKDKTIAETLKSSFLDAINQQSPQINSALINLIKELDDIITAKLSSLEPQIIQEQPETPSLESQQPVIEEVKQESVLDSFPTGTENPVAPGPEGTTTQTSDATNNTTPTSEQLLQQWEEQITAMRDARGNQYETEATLSKINELAPQLLSSGNKTESDLQKEFHNALEILMLKKKLPPSEVALKKEIFNRALAPERYFAYEQQLEQEVYQQNLAAEQEMARQRTQRDIEARNKAEAERIAYEKKQKETEMLAKASILELKEAGKLEIAKAHEQVRALNAKLAAEKNREKIAEQKAQETFAKTIQQQTAGAKKVAAEQKAAAEQGLLSKAVKMVTNTASNLWYGAQAPTSQTMTQLEEQQELRDLKTYLDSTQKDDKEKLTIKHTWEQFQKILHSTPQVLNQHSMELEKSWIEAVQQITKELVLTYGIISKEDICTKIRNILPLPSGTGPDYAAEIVHKIKTFLENAKAWQDASRKHEEATKLQQLEQRKERKERIQLVQQKAKDEEDRIERKQKEQLLAASNYKKEKQEWKQLLAQLSENAQATQEANNAHTLQAIQKSHALLNLASAIPAKNKQAVSQKLKQKFTVALLNQQKLSDNTINIHHNMDQFNKEINKALE